MRHPCHLAILMLVAAVAMPAERADAWDAHTHRTVTYIALDGLPAEAPAWLRAPSVRHRIAFQSNQVDRWRGWPALPLQHVTYPDHFMDVELLDQFGLTLESLPRLRREYVRALVLAKHTKPDRIDAYDADGDAARIHEWPGFLPYAISEEYAYLQAAFQQVRILEAIDEPARRHQLLQARSIAIDHLGNLAHFVADAAQPLHTTKHYNGWAGDNPHGYTTERTFHKYIDGGVIAHHAITYQTLKPRVTFARKVNAEDPWQDIAEHIRRGLAQVEPLYRLERDGELNGPAGKKFIESRLADATDMLNALVWAAYTSSAPTAEQIESWKHYNNYQPELLPGLEERD